MQTPLIVCSVSDWMTFVFDTISVLNFINEVNTLKCKIWYEDINYVIPNLNWVSWIQEMSDFNAMLFELLGHFLLQRRLNS